MFREVMDNMPLALAFDYNETTFLPYVHPQTQYSCFFFSCPNYPDFFTAYKTAVSESITSK